MPAASRDDLYSLTPGEFVAARNQLAKELKQAGKAAEAKEVAALKRPAAIAAAVDRAARKHPEAVEALIAADDKLRKAQAGGAGAESLKAAMGAHRDALRALAQAAESELPSVAPQQSRAIQTTLQGAVAGGAELRDRLRRGVLDEELAPPGFDLLTDLGASLAVNARTKPEPSKAPPRPAHEEPSHASKAGDRKAAHEGRQRDQASARSAKVEAARRARADAKAAAAARKAEAESLREAKVQSDRAAKRAEQLDRVAAKAEQAAARARQVAKEAEEKALAAKAAAAKARSEADAAGRRAKGT